MSDIKTISDSKRAFNKSFPRVIPAIYRRLADELLVELHLLSHQNDFKVDGLFCLGLTNVFDTFTKGYEPKDHLPDFFRALCVSNSFNPEEIRSEALRVQSNANEIETTELKKWFNTENKEVDGKLSKLFNLKEAKGNYYSRLSSIGLQYFLLGRGIKIDNSEEKVDALVSKLSNLMGVNNNKIQKDILQFNQNIEKMNQGLELLKEMKTKQIKKKNKDKT